jgi:hypothetical protein
MRIKKTTNLRRLFLAAALFLLFGFSCRNVFGTVNDLMYLDSSLNCEIPLVILQDGANQTSTIYTNNTSAKISIDANSSQLTYNYSLNIVSNNASLWEIKLEYSTATNISNVNTTIILHDNFTSSAQITIHGGSINQTDNYSNLASNATMHLGVMDLIENNPESSTLLDVYLRMRIANTTIYTLYEITFEFT